ncbi:MAG: helix-turn-helix domain-containing protein [Patescibacteria group bacterium]
MGKDIFTTSEVAKLLRVSRIAIFKKIKSGEIKAQKIGRNYIIRKADLPVEISGQLTKDGKRVIAEAVEKTVHEYGEALRLLGRE